MATKEQNIARLKELGALLGREVDTSGNAAEVAQRVAEWEEEVADGPGETVDIPPVSVAKQDSQQVNPGTNSGLVRVRMLYTVHLDAVADDSDNVVALALKGTCVRIPAEKLALLVQAGLVVEA